MLPSKNHKLNFNPNCITRMAAVRERLCPTRGASGVIELSETKTKLLTAQNRAY